MGDGFLLTPRAGVQAAVPKERSILRPEALRRQGRHFNPKERFCCRLAADSPMSNLLYNC